MIYKAQCPSCAHEFPTEVGSARKGLLCPKCATRFVPDSLIPEADRQDEYALELRELYDDARKVDKILSGSITLGTLFFIIAILAFFGGADFWSALAALAGFCFSIAFCSSLISQLVHIRIALQKSLIK